MLNLAGSYFAHLRQKFHFDRLQIFPPFPAAHIRKFFAQSIRFLDAFRHHLFHLLVQVLDYGQVASASRENLILHFRTFFGSKLLPVILEYDKGVNEYGRDDQQNQMDQEDACEFAEPHRNAGYGLDENHVDLPVFHIRAELGT